MFLNYHTEKKNHLPFQKIFFTWENYYFYFIIKDDKDTLKTKNQFLAVIRLTFLLRLAKFSMPKQHILRGQACAQLQQELEHLQGDQVVLP